MQENQKLWLSEKKSRIWKTKKLSIDADSRTDTILERLCDLSPKKMKKKKKEIAPQKPCF